MIKMRALLTGLIVTVAAATGISAVTHAEAFTACQLDSNSSFCRDQGDDVSSAGSRAGAGTVIRNIINVLLYIIGVASITVIVIAGIRYSASRGNQQGVSGAKNMLVGGVIGLVVAVCAYAIVNWVVGRFS